MRCGRAFGSRRSRWTSSTAPRHAPSAASCTAADSSPPSPARTCRAGCGPGSFTRMILAIDQGTTGTTCLVFDEEARLRSRAYREFRQHFPQPGWVEHDAAEIWEVSRAVAHEALGAAGVPAAALTAIGLTNQRETVVAWDEATGEPLHRAIVWQDRRTSARCDQLREQGLEDLVRERTGLVIDPYFSGAKIERMLDNAAGLRERTNAGGGRFGTVDAALAFKRTGRALTDWSNASRTMLFDIRKLEWDADLCEALGVPEAALPEPAL